MLAADIGTHANDIKGNEQFASNGILMSNTKANKNTPKLGIVNAA